MLSVPSFQEEEPVFAGIFVFKNKDKTPTTLLFPVDEALHTKGDNPLSVTAKSYSNHIANATSKLGACKVLFVDDSAPPRSSSSSANKREYINVSSNITFESDQTKPVTCYAYGTYLPLSPTIGVVSANLFLDNLRGAKKVWKVLVSSAVSSTPDPKRENNTSTDGFVIAEVLDPNLHLWYGVQTKDLYGWELPHDFVFLRLPEPLFTAYFIPHAFKNDVRHANSIVAEGLVNLGFALPPTDVLPQNISATTTINDIFHWMDMFPPNFQAQVRSDEEDELLAKAKVNNVKKVKDKIILSKVLESRLQLFGDVLDKKCVSLGKLKADEDEGWEKSCTFRCVMSLWPGLSGGPIIPLQADLIQNLHFIGTASGGLPSAGANNYISVSSEAFATGYTIFVYPTLTGDLAGAKAYIDQFSNLATSLDDIEKRRELEQAAEDSGG